MSFFNPRLGKDQVHLRISKSIDLILKDWVQTLNPSPPAHHDYSEIYAPSVSFRIAHDQLMDKGKTTPGGFHLKGRFQFKVAHRLGKMGLRLWVSHRYTRPRITCFPEAPPGNPPSSLSFRWLIEGIPQDAEGAGKHSLIIGGMAHYRFDEANGRVDSILIDRLIPPFRPGLTILEYLRSLRLQHNYSIEKES